MVEAALHLHIDFVDGRTHDEEISLAFPPGAEDRACMKVLTDLTVMGGLMCKNKDGAIEFYPSASMKLVTVKAPSVVSANLSDLSRLKPPSKDDVTL